MTEPSEEIKERCLFLKDSIMQSIRKHQSVVGIIFGESEETVRYVHVICITMKPKVVLIKNRKRKTDTERERAVRPSGGQGTKNALFSQHSRHVNSVKMAIKQEKEQDLGDYTEGAENFHSLGYQPEQLPDPDPAGHCSCPLPAQQELLTLVAGAKAARQLWASNFSKEHLNQKFPF